MVIYIWARRNERDDKTNADVAQLDRAFGYEPKGSRFESWHPHERDLTSVKSLFFYTDSLSKILAQSKFVCLQNFSQASKNAIIRLHKNDFRYAKIVPFWTTSHHGDKMEYKEQVLRKVIRHIFLSRRQQQGLTQNNLSEISNITRQFISQVESGKRQPSVQTMGNLASAYGLSLAELFKEVDALYIQFDRDYQPPQK